MTELSLGVMAHSRKESERRLALHPRHIERIDPDLRERIYLERGYGERFGLADADLAPQVGGLVSRAEIVAICDVVLLPKPLAEDVRELRTGQVLLGWPHCVQDAKMTQLAVDQRLTLIAFEAMNHWTPTGAFSLHVFHKNNELAGYCSVLHALALVGTTGQYGRRLNAAVIGFGATARGAVTALKAHGVNEIDALTQRQVAAVASPIHSVRMLHFDIDGDDGGDGRSAAGRAPTGAIRVLEPEGPRPVAGFLAEHDIVVNCVLQDTDAPLVFVSDDELSTLASGSLVIDVSCDEAMGFGWARPTSFADPMFTVGDNVAYYAVDHSPSYLWNSATWEISEALLPHLRTVLSGPAAWEADEVVGRAIEIRDGVIRNPAILSFQHRDPDYPHNPR